MLCTNQFHATIPKIPYPEPLLSSPYFQFQSFVQFRGKLKSRSSDEIQILRENTKVWNIHSVLNVLYSLVEKSNINQQVRKERKGAEELVEE